MGLFNLFKKKDKVKEKTTSDSTITNVIKQLEELAYFQHVAPEDLEKVKAETGYGVAIEHYLPLLESEESPFRILHPAHYAFDNEDIFEQNGIIGMLSEMEPFLNKLQVVLNVTEHIEIWDDANESLHHEMCINGKRYVLFEDFKAIGWGEATQRFADMVNDQLALQGVKERLYLICGGNDGRAVLLTTEQAALFAKLIPSLYERPLDTHTWCKVMEVEWKNICE